MVFMESYLSNMYIGEDNRDATSKIRGFLYQDLVAVGIMIKALQEGENINLLLEVVEDICIGRENETEIIQVKYYPRSQVNYKEIYRELFYQFIKLRELGYTGNIKCNLAYHTNRKRISNHKDNIEKLIKVGEKERELRGKEFLESIIKDEYGAKRDKSNREDYFFERTEKEELEAFKEVYSERYSGMNIGEYREYLKEELLKLIQDKLQVDIDEEEVSKEVGIAIAIGYMQESYNDENSKLEDRKRSSGVFLDKVETIFKADDDLKIIYLIKGYIDEVLGEIVDELNDNKDVYEKYIKIGKSTKEFFEEFLSDSTNQSALIHTISCQRNSNKISITKIAEHRDKFQQFLQNVWKILFNLGCTDFRLYINEAEKKYIQFSFPNFKYSTVIMGELGLSSPKKEIQAIRERHKKMDKKKPKCWFLRTEYDRAIGIKNYSIDVAEIIEELEGDTRYIYDDDTYILECLSCIELEEKYAIKEECQKCIFNNKKCVKGKW